VDADLRSMWDMQTSVPGGSGGIGASETLVVEEGVSVAVVREATVVLGGGTGAGESISCEGRGVSESARREECKGEHGETERNPIRRVEPASM